MADIVVKTEDVVKEYRMGSNVLRALDGINIEIRARGIHLVDGALRLRQIYPL